MNEQIIKFKDFEIKKDEKIIHLPELSMTFEKLKNFLGEKNMVLEKRSEKGDKNI